MQAECHDEIYLSEKEVRSLIKGKIRFGKDQKQLAKDLGVGESYLSDVLNGKKGLGPKILKKLKLEIVYKQKG